MPDQETGGRLRWTYSPWRSNWLRPTAVLLLDFFFAALAGWSFSTPNVWPAALAWGGFSLVVLLGATMTIYLPVVYLLDEKGVTVRFLGAPSFRKWEHYRNFYVHETGVHLTTMPTPSPLDPFRGHYLLFDGNKEAVVGILKQRIERADKASG